ncbi:MAG TPA: hypothetical protein VM285_14000, partial [Polyangia bacterium]|nr:hypothetical protein [Polyangia bacterium]
SSISVSDEVRQVEHDIADDQQTAANREMQEQTGHRRDLAARVSPCVGENKVTRYLALVGPEERLAHVRAKRLESPLKALEFLVIALADEELPLLYREEAAGLLGELADETFGYNPQAETASNEGAILRVCDRIRAMKKTSDSQAEADDE